MPFEEYLYGKVSPDKKLSPEKAKNATKAIRRTNFENEMPRAEADVQKQMREGLKTRESFKALFSGFNNDVVNIRKMVAAYNSLADDRLKGIKGDEILDEFENISQRLEEQIEIASDINEKSDFDNILLELKGVVKRVSESPEAKRVNG